MSNRQIYQASQQIMNHVYRKLASRINLQSREEWELDRENRGDQKGIYVGDNENNEQTAEEVLSCTLATLRDEKLTEFALRLVLTGHTDLPREGDIDFLPQAEVAFVPLPPKKQAAKQQKPTVTKEASPPARNLVSPKKRIAA